LEGYSAAPETGPWPNDDDGRNTADVTPWLECFMKRTGRFFAGLEGGILKQPVLDKPQAKNS
jgi:hypothetical protein